MQERDVRNARVNEVMHEDWPTLTPDDTIETAIRLFAERRISGAPVIEDGGIVGILTEGDLILRDAELRVKQLEVDADGPRERELATGDGS